MDGLDGFNYESQGIILASPSRSTLHADDLAYTFYDGTDPSTEGKLAKAF
jgi:hypothetical protein